MDLIISLMYFFQYNDSFVNESALHGESPLEMQHYNCNLQFLYYNHRELNRSFKFHVLL